jgi:hypothetical protein
MRQRIRRVCVFGGGEMSNIELRTTNVEVGFPPAHFSIQHSVLIILRFPPPRHRHRAHVPKGTWAVPHHRERPSRPTALHANRPGAPRASAAYLSPLSLRCAGVRFGGGEMSNIELRTTNVEVGFPPAHFSIQHSVFIILRFPPPRHRHRAHVPKGPRAVPHHRERPSRPTALHRNRPGAPRASAASLSPCSPRHRGNAAIIPPS